MTTFYEYYLTWDAIDYGMAALTGLSLVAAIASACWSVGDDYRYCRSQRRAK